MCFPLCMRERECLCVFLEGCDLSLVLLYSGSVLASPNKLILPPDMQACLLTQLSCLAGTGCQESRAQKIV